MYHFALLAMLLVGLPDGRTDGKTCPCRVLDAPSFSNESGDCGCCCHRRPSQPQPIGPRHPCPSGPRPVPLPSPFYESDGLRPLTHYFPLLPSGLALLDDSHAATPPQQHAFPVPPPLPPPPPTIPLPPIGQNPAGGIGPVIPLPGGVTIHPGLTPDGRPSIGVGRPIPF